MATELSAGVAAVGVATATTGWIITVRRQRKLSRKQHTITVLFQMNCNKDYAKSLSVIVNAINARRCEDGLKAREPELLEAFDIVFTHLEFIASCLRNGDFDEQLVIDNGRSTIIGVYESCRGFMRTLTDSPDSNPYYEHLEWLYLRWQNPPGFAYRLFERLRERPLSGPRVKRRERGSDLRASA